MSIINNSFSSCSLYTPGAFFFYPWKPVLLYWFGDGYESAYRHFRRDHSDPLNLMLHFVCLFFQLVGNFALLGRADSFVEPYVPAWNGEQPRWLTLTTIVLWMLTLMSAHGKGSPPLCTFLSGLSMGAAYLAAPHIPAKTLELGAMAAYLLGLITGSLFFDRSRGPKGSKRVSLKGLIMDVIGILGTFVLVLTPRFVVQYYRYSGKLSSEADTVFYIVIALMALISATPKPLLPGVFYGVFVVRTSALLIESETLMYFSVAMVAMTMQGRAHDITKQRATLVSLEDSGDYRRAKKLAFEWSHVCFFPALLWRSALQSYHAGYDGKPVTKGKTL